MSRFDEPPRLSYLAVPSEPNPDAVRDERIDAELEELFEGIESGTVVEILEEVLKK